MGSGSSRLESRKSRARVNRGNRGNRSKLFSVFPCGGSSSRAALEMEEYPDNYQVNSPGCCDPGISEVLNATEESSFNSGTEISPSSCDIESGVSSEISVLTSERILGENSLMNHDLCNGRNCLSECKELVSPNQVSDHCSNDESYRNRSSNGASTSFKEHQSSDPVSMTSSANNDSVNDIDNSENKAVSRISSENRDPSSSSPPGNQGSHSDLMSAESHMGEVTTMLNSDSDSIPHRSNVPLSFDLLRDESIREAVPSDLGLLMSSGERGIGDGSILHVDVVSISSSIFSSSSPETSGRESRRNRRRLFRDAFSRRSSRGNIDSPTIIFSSDDTEDMSTHDRWLLDLGGDFLDDAIASDSGYLGSRIHRLNARRRHSRSEIWGRLRGGLHDSGRFGSYCPSGLHPDGSCSCESFLMTEESSTRASISRIVMLAEALFEVLDEIHRQPVSLSLMSHPAPESIVDSFPLKNYKDIGKSKGDDDAEQCYICLAEYEEGDKIRVLPCHHEYHMACVDKWLKEIHGYCHCHRMILSLVMFSFWLIHNHNPISFLFHFLFLYRCFTGYALFVEEMFVRALASILRHRWKHPPLLKKQVFHLYYSTAPKATVYYYSFHRCSAVFIILKAVVYKHNVLCLHPSTIQ